MLIRLTGDQIAKYWKSMIREAIEEALPTIPADPETALNEILSQMLQEKLQCWACTDGKSSDIIGISTTQVTLDNNTKERSMLIYTAFAFEIIPDDQWQENYIQLAEFAKGCDCSRIYCYSDNEKVIRMAKENGADSAQVLLSFPLL